MARMEIRTLVEADARHPRNDGATMIELKDGSLLLAWMEHIGGDLAGHDHSPAHVVAMISEDGGRTWKDKRELAKAGPNDVNVHFPNFLRLRSGEILFYYLIYHHLRPGTTHKASGFLCWSSDEGRTFTPPKKHDVLRDRNVTGSVPVMLSTGRIILPCLRLEGEWCGQTPEGYPKDKCYASCCYSDDDGRTWKESESWITLPLRGAMELHVAELRDGRLLGYMRTQLGAVFQTESRDGGVTWSKPQTTGLKAPESMPCLTRIPKTGDLLLVWNNSPYDPEFDHYGKRTPLTVAISRDDGRTWENFKDLETDPEWEFTNPSPTWPRRWTTRIPRAGWAAVACP